MGNTVRAILDQKGNQVVTVTCEDTLAQAILKLTQHKIGAVVVIDEEGTLRGILSERDIVKYMAGKMEVPTSVQVCSIMTKSVTYVKLHQNLDECFHLMTTGRFRHLPVFDEGKLQGIISIGDVVKAALAERDFQIGQLEYYITNTF